MASILMGAGTGRMSALVGGSVWVLAVCLLVAAAAEGRRLKQDEGDAAVEPRIVNGNTAERGRFPFVVSLKTFFTQRHFCGGALVAPNVVITAAHCVDPNNPQAEVRPRVNIGGLKRRDSDAELRFTCKTILHENWSGDVKQGFDLAAIILDKPSSKQHVDLDIGGTQGEGLRLTALGWGRTNLGTFADELQQMSGFVMISNQQCNLNVVYNGLLKDSMLCADGGAVDTCEGDSGGPLIFEDSDSQRDILVGVTSFGPEICGSRRLPSVGTRISVFHEWIKKIIVENPTCSPADRSPVAAEPESPFSPAPTDSCQAKSGVDLNGGIKPMNDGRQTIVQTTGECCNLCKKTDGCKAWTWISEKTEFNPKGACWMRNAVPADSPCPVCVSGTTQAKTSDKGKTPPPSSSENPAPSDKDAQSSPPQPSKNQEGSCGEVLDGVDFQGFDIDLNNVPNTQDPSKCCELCNNDDRCKSWTRTDDGRCFKKYGVPKISICAGCNSGIVRTRVSSEEINPIKELMGTVSDP